MTQPRPFIGPVATPARVPTQCTNWAAYGLSEIWQMLEGEDGRTSWPQAQAWQRMEQLCAYQATQLRQAADALAQLWPPERSEAAKVFMDVVLTMAHSMDESATAAKTNAIALADLTVGIAETRERIATLVEQLHQREQEHDQRERETLPWLRGYTGLIDEQRADLDKTAQQIMRAADIIPAEANAAMRLPAQYAGITPYTELNEPLDPTIGVGGGTAELVRAPMVPVPDFDPPSPRPGFPPLTFPGMTPDDPVLAGGPGPAMPVAPGSTSLPTPVGAPAWPPLTWFPAGGFAAGTPGGGVRVQPPGGVIGAPSGSSTRPADTRQQSVPSGSVRAATGAAATGTPMMAPPMMSRPGSAAGAPTHGSHLGYAGGIRRRQVDPDDPWAVKQGGPAVLEPAPEPDRHDPGPGVIGIDW